MFDMLSDQILATVAYADIFDYPLTKVEIGRWLIGQKISQPVVDATLKKLVNQSIYDQLYFCLPGRTEIILKREERQKFAISKIIIAKKAAAWLSLIPTVRFVGVTGGLAIRNTRDNDDIDLFIIASNGCIWITRLLVVLLIDLILSRRKVGESDVSNKICLNMFITPRALAFPKIKQDLFLAHEVMQMKSVIDKDNLYHQLLILNKWVKKYLPNAWEEKYQDNNNLYSQKYSSSDPASAGESRSLPAGRQATLVSSRQARTITNQNLINRANNFTQIIIRLIRIFEPLAKYTQLRYMQKHRTTEEISDDILRFHPRDNRNWVYQEYRNRLDKINIPIDKEFF
jgi:hypothetical protein